jgi:uncharacterized membrane protein
MDSVTQKLIPGIVALVCGFVFTVCWKSFVQAILHSHGKFWKETFKLHGDVGKYGELFLKIIILFLGVAFFLSGVLLIYQYIRK